MQKKELEFERENEPKERSQLMTEQRVPYFSVQVVVEGKIRDTSRPMMRQEMNSSSVFMYINFKKVMLTVTDRQDDDVLSV